MLCRPIRHLNEFKLTNDFLNLPWSVLDVFNDMDNVVYNYNSMLLNVWDRRAPVKSRPVSSTSHPWITSDVNDMLLFCGAFFQKFMQSKSTDMWLTYKQLRNRCITAIRIAKRNFFTRCARSKPKAFWCQMKSCTDLGNIKAAISPWPCSIPAIYKESANAVNQHFILSVSAHVFQCDTPSTLLLAAIPMSSSPTAPVLQHRAFLSAQSPLWKLNTRYIQFVSGTIDSDDLSSHMVRLSCKGITTVICKIFNTSIRCAQFPSARKKAIVTPVYKKGNKFMMNSNKFMMFSVPVNLHIAGYLTCLRTPIVYTAEQLSGKQ